MRFFVTALLCLSTHVPVEAAQKPAFISPQWQDTTSKAPFAGNSRWPLGSSQVVAFASPWESYRIEFWQGILSGGARRSTQLVYNQSDGETLPQSFHWTVQTYDLQLSQSPVFFFWLYDNHNSSNQQSSPNFNITIGTTSPSSTAPRSTTTRSVSSRPTAAATTTPGTPSSSSTPVSAAAASTGLSRGAAAGIGVGAALGGVIIAAAAVFLFLKRRQRRQSSQQGSEPAGYSSGSPDTAAVYYTKPIEAAGYERPVEAPTYHHQQPVEIG